jgi:hypothetical protein
MNVKMVGNAGAGGSTQIHTNVESRRRVTFTQCRLGALRQIHHLIRDRFRRRIKLARVQVRHDHQMPGDVRVQIQNDERLLAAMENEVRLVAFSVTRDTAKDTLTRL